MQPQGPLRLSEAIRAGSQLTEQVQTAYLRVDPETDKISGACAFGAAWVGVHGVDEGWQSIGLPLAGIWPEISNARLVHPVTGGTNSIYYIVVTLNDDYNWTRERIADWLEKEGY